MNEDLMRQLEEYLRTLFNDPKNIDGLLMAHKIGDFYTLYNYKKDLLRQQRNNRLAGLIPAAIDFGQSAYNGFLYDKSAEDLSADYGLGNTSSLGVLYNTLNLADARLVAKEEHYGNVAGTTNTIAKGAVLGGTIGSVIPGLGTVAGGFLGGAVGGALGLLGGGKRHAQMRRALEEQKRSTIRTNEYNGDLATTIGMLQSYYKNYGNPENQLLMSTKVGKDSMIDANAVMDPEELIVHEDGTAEKPIGGIPGKDSVGVHLLEGDKVLTSNYESPETGQTYAEMAEPLYAMQKYLHGLINRNKGKNNQIARNVALKYLNMTKDAILDIADNQRFHRMAGDTNLPKEQVAFAAPGIDNWGNIILTVAGLGTAIGGILQARGSKVHRPNVAVKNPYETRAINDLYSLRPDNLAIRRQVRDAEARGRYQLRSAGGLNTAQKSLANIALTANTQQSIANAEAQALDRANALTSNAAQYALNSGAASAQLAQQANIYNNTNYLQSASAKQNIIRDYFAQIPGMLGQYWKNYYQQTMGRNMLALYQLDLDLERERIKKGV